MFRDISELITLEGAAAKAGRNIVEADLSAISRAAMVGTERKDHLGRSRKELPAEFAKTKFNEISFGGMPVMPALLSRTRT